MKNFNYAVVIIIFFITNTILAQSPKLEWSAKYKYTSTSEQYSYGFEIDKDRNVYMGVNAREKPQNPLINLIKYDSEGNLKWQTKFDNPTNKAHYMMEMAVNEQGDSYILGYNIDTSSHISTWETIKCDNSGNIKWVKTFSNDGTPWKLKLDNDNNIIAAGTTTDSSDNLLAAVVKYDADGNMLWNKIINPGIGAYGTLIYDMKIDSKNNIVFAASFPKSDFPSYKNAYLYKLNSNGTELWHKVYSDDQSLRNYDNYATAVNVDNSDNIYFTVNSLESSLYTSNIIVQKFNPGGTELWTNISDSYSYANISSIVNNKLYVEGLLPDSAFSFVTSEYLFTYDDNGNKDTVLNLSDKFYDKGLFFPSNILPAKDNNIFITGYLNNDTNNGDSNVFAVKLNPATENILWSDFYSSKPDTNYDQSVAALIDDDFNLYINAYTTAYSFTEVTTEPVVIIKYSENVTGINSKNISVNDYSLEQNYPNPFNPSTSINFSIAKSTFVQLDIFNSLGQKVKTLISENLQAGKYKANFNGNEFSSGVYFYRLSADNFIKTNKMILLK